MSMLKMWNKCWFWRKALAKMLAPLKSVAIIPTGFKCARVLSFILLFWASSSWKMLNQQMRYMYDPSGGKFSPMLRKIAVAWECLEMWRMGFLSGTEPAGFQTQAIGATLLIVWRQMQRNSKDKCPNAWNVRKCNNKVNFCLPEIKLTQFRRKYAGILSLCSLSWLPTSLFYLFWFFHLPHLVEIWTESEFKFLSGFCGISCMVICLTSLQDCEITKPWFVLVATMKICMITVTHYPFCGYCTTPTYGLHDLEKNYPLAEFFWQI